MYKVKNELNKGKAYAIRRTKKKIGLDNGER